MPISQARAEPDFTGFRPGLRKFLKELQANNDRDWFHSQQDRFESEVREPALAFTRAIRPHVLRICPRLVIDASRTGGSMLRMHRDIRFSADRRPYHTRVFLSFPHEDEERATAPGFWLRVRPDAVHLGVGVRPRGPVTLRRIRRHIDEHRRRWAAATENEQFVSTFGAATSGVLGPPELRRVPAGYDADHPFATDLRRKDFRAEARVRLADVARPDFVDQAVEAFESGAPYLRFLCDALGLSCR